MSELQRSALELLENMVAVRDAVAGYRESLKRDNGFADAAAEQMAVDFHRYLLTMMTKAAT